MARSRNPQRGQLSAFSLIGILVALLIMGLLAERIMKTSVMKPAVDKDTAQSLGQAGVRTDNYSALLNSVKSELNGINQRQQAQLDAAEGVRR